MTKVTNEYNKQSDKWIEMNKVTNKEKLNKVIDR